MEPSVRAVVWIPCTGGDWTQLAGSIASNLAIAFAQNNNRTLLIDADLKRPAVHKHHETLERRRGLTAVLTGELDIADAIQD